MQAAFNPMMKMAALIESDCHLLPILSRLGMTSSFGEQTIEQTCDHYGIDAATFCLICNVYSSSGFKPSAWEIALAKPDDVVFYLHASHNYYLDSALTVLEPKLEELLKACSAKQSEAVRKFFSEYETELRSHFSFEEEKVFPYIKKLIGGGSTADFNIDKFKDNHSNVDEKLGDLKSIIMKSLPDNCDGNLRLEILDLICHLQRDLARHTCVEEDVLIPLVRRMENPALFRKTLALEKEKEADEREELSDREKEILVCVARGMLNKEIADQNNISIHTVISHRKNITRKIGIKTVAGLTVYAILNGLIDVNTIE
ncbi:MAG: helix-turn-helix transcriptional regulator [Bacteroidales bacterium]|nr:helix-turn-helix transcriptional regulator [Bacteroidales bacterium]